MEAVLKNALVYTSNAARPWADTLVVDGSRIAFVGKESDWDRRDPIAEIDMEGRMILPGLIDSHTHPTRVAKSQWHVRLPWTHDLAEILRFIREFGDEHPKEEMPFLYFEYYPSTLFGDGRPTKELLDSAISDRPVLCQDHSEHSHWVNSRMLELLEVTKDTPDPMPGLEMFARDEHGQPTGHVLENAHQHFLQTMYDSLGWCPPEEITAENILPVLRFMSEYGVTALFEALTDDEDTLRALSELEADGKLHLYYEGSQRFRTLDDLPAAVAKAQELQSTYGSGRIRTRTLKLFLDGTNENGNSALLEPWSNDPAGQNLGEIQMEAAELTECLLLCNSSDLDLHIHMVGDRAFRTACDAVEAARARTAATGEPWRTQVTFAHCELVDPQDMARPAELDIIVNWTTHWSGGYFGEESKNYLGEARWNRMYEFNAIAEHGAALTFSSDVVTNYELHRASPFFGMQVAQSRIDPEFPLDTQKHADGVRPNGTSRLTLERMLNGYTIAGARQLRIDDRVGSLEVGKVANFVVLPENVFGLGSAELRTMKPSAVFFEGETVVGSL
ncbi:amidohydrolase family protein [Streptomyces sp. NPDC048278]|uniref:amidohydrolase n=1 Tax=Streptomyces sp. NPDC048278 TaxID=3155809 RepID=UPI00341C3F27